VTCDYQGWLSEGKIIAKEHIVNGDHFVIIFVVVLCRRTVTLFFSIVLTLCQIWATPLTL
jgi:hypothetical protein